MMEPESTERLAREAEEHANSEAVREALPAGFICPKCDYDLGGASVKVCSECGRPIVKWDVVVLGRLMDSASDLRVAQRRFRVLMAIVVVVMGGGAMMLSLDVVAGVVGAVVSMVALMGSLIAGWVAAALAPERDRAAIRVAWLSALPWLNMPWLALPVLAIGAVVLGLAAASLPAHLHPHETVMALGGVVAGCVWLLISVGGVVQGMRCFGDALRERGVRRRAWWSGIVVAFLVVIGGAMLQGLSGLIFAAEAIDTLVWRWMGGM